MCLWVLVGDLGKSAVGLVIGFAEAICDRRVGGDCVGFNTGERAGLCLLRVSIIWQGWNGDYVLEIHNLFLVFVIKIPIQQPVIASSERFINDIFLRQRQFLNHINLVMIWFEGPVLG